MQDFPSKLKIATVWLLAGLLLFVGVQAWQAHRGASRVEVSAGAIEIRRAPDGHYHWPGHLNGVAVDFLVDTGATTTAVPLALAKRAGLEADFAVESSTAGGRVSGHSARADLVLSGGVRATALRVTVLPALDAPLLGMDILSKMRFSQQGGVLRIEMPRGASQ
jgi:aspartyl protease family protein